jgi:hypothetical protein
MGGGEFGEFGEFGGDGAQFGRRTRVRQRRE